MPPMHRSRLADREPFQTLDGSTIREIAHPAWTAARNQSLAEATVAPGTVTEAHLHRRAEELYFFTSGRGRMRLGDEELDVAAGDCVVIPPGTEHALANLGPEPLVLLCCCSPAYSHEDTVLTGSRPFADTTS
jgi:mannose-6-phosphate isomerase-like protein (cupin superfamily)